LHLVGYFHNQSGARREINNSETQNIYGAPRWRAKSCHFFIQLCYV